jgi:hypothetical protein
VNTPTEALQQIRGDYEVYRCVATYSFSSRRKRALLREIEHTLGECKRAVSGSQDAGDGALASEWREVEEFVGAQCAEVRMWLFLDDDNTHAAWDALLEAQIAAYRAARWLPDFEPAQHIDDHLQHIECVIVPRQQFLSPAMIVQQTDVECSICTKRGDSCEHIAGELYGGEICANIVHSIRGVREISLVDSTANKYARVLKYGDIDTLTGKPTKSKSRKRRAHNPALR